MILRRLGIRSRALLLAIAPLTVAAVLIGAYLVNTRLEDARLDRTQHGVVVARDLAKSSGFGLYVGDEKLLQTLISGALASPGIDAVLIVNDEGTVVASKSRTKPGETTGESVGHDREFTEAIYPPRTESEGGEYDSNRSWVAASPVPLGKVSVRVTYRDLVERETEVFQRSAGFALLGIILSAMLGAWLSSSLLAPLQQIFDVVSRLRNGDLGARTVLTNKDEFGMLESGINEMAETIEHAQRDLQQRIEIATEQIQATVSVLRQRNRELEVARQAAESSGNAKAAFLAQMSHELRTPLNAIIGFGHLLETTTDPLDRREYAQIVAQSGEQLLTVINDVLSYSRIGSGNVEIHNEPFDAAAAVEDAVALFAHEAHKNDLELVLQYSLDAPRRARGDPARFAQVLGNLLNNAIKFTDSGSVIVLAAAEHDDAGNPLLKITVTDTGIGLGKQSRARLFEPFAQGDASITRRFGGTGLGLAISKSLITRMGGAIGVAEHEGEGSAFFITLPADLDAGEGENAAPAAQFDGRALVIDTHPVSRRVLRNTLLQLGFQVSQASALTAASREPAAAAPKIAFDLIVAGLNRREAESQENLSAVRALQSTARHILVLVGDERASRRLADTLRGDRYQVATKPIRREALAQRLIRQLDMKDQPELPVSATPDAHPPLRVLIGEDNAFGRRLLGAQLADLGAAIDEAADGQQALELAHTRAYDAILLDVHMPRLDGGSVCRTLRSENGPNRQAPIFAVTADAAYGTAEGASAWGFNDAILKPVSPRDLREVLGRWLPGIFNAATRNEPSSTATPGTLIEVRRLLTELRRALAFRDREAIKSAAHQLCGVAGFFELAELSHVAKSIETAALHGAFDNLQNSTDKLDAILNALLTRPEEV